MTNLFEHVNATERLRPASRGGVGKVFLSKRFTIWMLLLGCLGSSSADDSAKVLARRAAYFEAAREVSESLQRDVAVFCHGSDWCRYGERIKEVWDSDDFAARLGTNFVLVAIDYPERPRGETDAAAHERDNGAMNVPIHNYPAVVLWDQQDRAYASHQGPWGDEESMADWMLEALEGRRERDRLWEAADQQVELRRAELLAEGLEAIGVHRHPFGHENVYRPIVDAMLEADPLDETSYARKFFFDPDLIHGEAMKLVDSKKFEEALDRVDRELYQPGNSLLSSEKIQKIHMVKFHIYNRWPGHEAERFEVLRNVVGIDRDTTLGVGAQGYLLMHHLGPVTMTYGWGSRHVRPGTNTWHITVDTDRHFDHDGAYRLNIYQGEAEGAMTIREVALLRGAEEVSNARHLGELDGKGASVSGVLRLPDGRSDGNRESIALHVTYIASTTNSSGQFKVTPLLE